MADRFNIIDYLSGLTTYVFDKAVLKCIALERGVYDVEDYESIDAKTRELLRADLLYMAYLSPNVWASQTNSHGSYSQTTGSQTVLASDKERIYNTFMAIYRKYNDDKLAEIATSESNLQWL